MSDYCSKLKDNQSRDDKNISFLLEIQKKYYIMVYLKYLKVSKYIYETFQNNFKDIQHLKNCEKSSHLGLILIL